MAAIVATATCTAHRAVVEVTGQVAAERVLAERVAWLIALMQAMTVGIVAERWNARDLDLLAAGVGPDGRALPTKGWMAIRRLGWGCAAGVTDGGVYSSDRVRRCSEEQAARMLRAALHRRDVVAAMLATWPENPRRRTEVEWKALRAALPVGVSAAEIRNRTRQICAVLQRDGVLPVDITDVEEPPQAAAQAVLAAADKQLVILTRTGDMGTGVSGAVLRVQLPLTASPASRKDWAWHAIAFTLPPTVSDQATLCTPTVRIAAGKVRIDLPFQTQIPAAPAIGHTMALGLDWGVDTLLTGAIARLRDGRVISDGRTLRYDATAISAKLHRLRGQREHLAVKRDHCAALVAGLDPADADNARRVALERAHRVLQVEHERVCARIRHLNKALAWSAARWAVDQAAALGAGVIYLEDLATLEARGVRRSNAALSGQVRGAVLEAIRHLAAKDGIAVVTVPARGTSRYCPRCGEGGSMLRHVPAPDRLGERGWKWAYCPACGLSCDRDHAAAERIAARGLLAQQHTRTDSTTGVRSIAVTREGNVARSRRRKNPPVRRDGPGAPAPTCTLALKPGTATRTAPPPNGGRPTALPRHVTRRSAVCLTGARCPPPPPARPGRDSVRRARHPRHLAHRRDVQGLYAILTTGPASTVSPPPLSSPWEPTEAARHAPRPPGLP